jgi:hypothetical protein
MALISISPFTYHAFNVEAGESVLAIINQLKKYDPDFWQNTLNRYTFHGRDYHWGEKVRIEFNKELSAYTEIGELFEIANKILNWGGMDDLTDSMKQNLADSLSCLKMLAQDKSIDLERLCVDRLASITKVYEMWDINNWVIYDSYCARGLEWLIAGFWNQIGYRKNEDLLKLPWPPGRVGSPVSGFPRAADTSPKQKRLGFIYGSWLCKAIAERLTVIDSSRFYWRPYHIEMLAFQLGHEINQ